MKICVYSLRNDEVDFLAQLVEQLGIEVVKTQEEPSLDNRQLVEGCQGVCVLGLTRIGKELLDCWHAMGVKYISTRTIGFNHIDVAYANSLGMRVCNAAYDPNGVADFTVMLMLMCLRKVKNALMRQQVQDYSLVGLQGREMHNLTVGVMGTGRIGQTVIQNLSGFGCRILAYDVMEQDEVKKYAQYVSRDELMAQSDIITLHMPLLSCTQHVICKKNLAKMKDGVILVNASRGELADPEALMEGLESGKIGALGLDTVEGENGIIHVDHRTDIVANRPMGYLRQFPNVVMTQHMAFYTQEAVYSMVRCGLEGIVDMDQHEKGATELVLNTEK